MHEHKSKGIIINRRSVKDADRFLSILTADEGKISVYAHAVRSIKSKRMSSLDLFNVIRFETVGDIGRRTLTHVELVTGFREGKRKLSDITRLFVIGELVDSLLEENDPTPEVYELLETALGNIHRFDTPEYLLRFKKKLLRLLGYWDTALADKEVDNYIESLLSRPLRATRQLL